MPRRTFERLDVDKRRGILTAAAEEFARHGYYDASLNTIIEQAGLSKGAMYYYFEDKADLFHTTLMHRFGALFDQMAQSPAPRTAGEFWKQIADLSDQKLRMFRDDPVVAGLSRAILQMVVRGEQDGTLKPLVDASIAATLQLVERGKAVGAVRIDVPADFIMAVLRSLDDGLGRWMAANMEKMSWDELVRISRSMMQMLRAMLSPPSTEKEP